MKRDKRKGGKKKRFYALLEFLFFSFSFLFLLIKESTFRVLACSHDGIKETRERGRSFIYTCRREVTRPNIKKHRGGACDIQLSGPTCQGIFPFTETSANLCNITLHMAT